MPAPPPTPTALKKLQGKATDRREPKPDQAMPARPAGLTGQAASLWDELAGPMHECGLLSVLDAHGLASYCTISAEARECWRQCDATGGMIVTVGGKPQRNPWAAEAMKLEELSLKLRNELGLNPTSRARLQIQQPDDDAPAPWLRLSDHQREAANE